MEKVTLDVAALIVRHCFNGRAGCKSPLLCCFPLPDVLQASAVLCSLRGKCCARMKRPLVHALLSCDVTEGGVDKLLALTRMPCGFRSWRCAYSLLLTLHGKLLLRSWVSLVTHHETLVFPFPRSAPVALCPSYTSFPADHTERHIQQAVIADIVFPTVDSDS